MGFQGYPAHGSSEGSNVPSGRSRICRPSGELTWFNTERPPGRAEWSPDAGQAGGWDAVVTGDSHGGGRRGDTGAEGRRRVQGVEAEPGRARPRRSRRGRRWAAHGMLALTRLEVWGHEHRTFRQGARAYCDTEAPVLAML